MKMKIKLSSSVLGAYLLLSGNVQAALITVNAADYNVGDDVSNAPGATLAYYSHASLSNSITYDAAIIGSQECGFIHTGPCSFNTIGGGTGENGPLNEHLDFGRALDTIGWFAGVSLTADQGRLSSFEFTGFSNSGDHDNIFLFGKNDNFLWMDNLVPTVAQDCPIDEQGSPEGCWKYSYSADLSNQDVYKVMFGSWSSVTWIDSVSYSVVPIPSAVWLFGSGLLGLIGIARRKKA